MFEWPEKRIQNRRDKTGRKTGKGGIIFFGISVSQINKFP
jgi:hypothetical protein